MDTRKFWLDSNIDNKVFFVHENKIWSYWIGKDYNGRVILNVRTKREVKDYLRQLFPNKKLVHFIPYREGARWNGYKQGSRPVKIKYNYSRWALKEDVY